jgi:hypothetical protein
VKEVHVRFFKPKSDQGSLAYLLYFGVVVPGTFAVMWVFVNWDWLAGYASIEGPGIIAAYLVYRWVRRRIK